MDHFARNKEWWHKKAADFPFHVVTYTTGPNPRELPMTFGAFIRVPFEDHAIWAFLDQKDADTFKDKYASYVKPIC